VSSSAAIARTFDSPLRFMDLLSLPRVRISRRHRRVDSRPEPPAPFVRAVARAEEQGKCRSEALRRKRCRAVKSLHGRLPSHNEVNAPARRLLPRFALAVQFIEGRRPREARRSGTVNSREEEGESRRSDLSRKGTSSPSRRNVAGPRRSRTRSLVHGRDDGPSGSELDAGGGASGKGAPRARGSPAGILRRPEGRSRRRGRAPRRPRDSAGRAGAACRRAGPGRSSPAARSAAP